MPAFDPTRPLAAGVTLLEASAGTGKTYNITSVVLRLVAQEGVGIHEILVVTFTDAATAELRDRVRTRLRDAAVVLESMERGGGEPKDQLLAAIAAHARRTACGLELPRRRLREALQRFDDAAIFTIHGFCHRVLREHAFECGAEFDAELLQDPEELLDEVVRDFWAREVADRPVELVAGLLGAGLSMKELLDLSRKVLRDPEMELVPGIEPEVVGIGEAGPVWNDMAGEWMQAREKCSAGWLDHGEEIRRRLSEGMATRALNGTKWRPGYLTSRAAEMDSWANDPARKLPGCFEKFGAAYMAASNNNGHAPPTHPLFDDVDALLALETRREVAVRQELLLLKHACASYVRCEFERRKRERRLQTYDDLLRQVQRALREREHGGMLRDALRARYRAALIDEFQDTDAVQWEIFRSVFDSGEHHLVLIGDPKQAIYGFRGADIHTYLAARHAAVDEFDLDRNWRSDRPLVDAVNHLFSRSPRPFALEGIGYHQVRAQQQKPRLLAADGVSPLDIRFIARSDPRDATTILKRELNGAIPAMVAADIVRFLRSGARIVVDEEGGPRERPAGPRDIAVLVRKGKQARAIQEALRAVRVPSVLQGSESVYCTREADELRRVLAAVLEPSNAWAARAALATDLLGIAAAAELVEGNGAGPALGVGDALARLADDEGRWDAWMERLHRWGEAWTKRGFMRAFRTILEELELPRRLLALQDGERRMTNLLHLAELLHSAAVQERLQPAALLHWLGRQQALGNVREELRQLRLESDADAVQIVTMHRCKGLEYPLVWCPYLWDGALTLDHDKKHARFHDEVNGRVVRRLDVADNPDRTEHIQRLDDECFAENLRLAYVALTRARHRCTVYWGGLKDAGCSSLAWLLHGSELEDVKSVREGRERLKTHLSSKDDAALRETLDALVDGSGGTIGVSDADPTPVLPWVQPVREESPLEARRWMRTTPLDRYWRVGSFTGLTHGSRGVHAAPPPDDELHPEALADAQPLHVAADTEQLSGSEPAQLEGFPSSAKAGILFHEIFEKHDFGDAAALEPLVRDRLGAYGFDAALWAAPAAAALQEAIVTPLVGGGNGTAPLSLAAIESARRLNELRFEFPVAGGFDAGRAALDPAALARAFADHPGGVLPADYARRVASLGFWPLRGFMTGVIDLVSEHDGRWYVVDYKSNRLGARMGDYSTDRLGRAMAEADYFLQYHLYVVALHRYLSWRLGDEYDYEHDFGGVFYLFFRGMRPRDGANRGVFHDRPPLARIVALDRVLRTSAVDP